VLVGAGNVATCGNSNDEATAKLLDVIPGTVFADGDLAYDNGSKDRFSKCYNPTWGRHKARTRPVPGEIEYKTSGASGYFGYFGSAAGSSGKGYYSYDIGDWHVVALNSAISTAAGSAQEQWLRADLAASSKRCTIAYWHHPLFFSAGSTVNSAVKPLWDDLYAAGAELVVNGHYENYERFAPQTPGGTADTAAGIREFVVGTGGVGHNSFGTVAANSAVRNSSTYGVLQLTLSDDGSNSYTWQFVPVAGQSFTDSGSGSCHDAAPPPPPPPPPPPGGVVLVGAGDIANCSSTGDEGTAALLDGIQGTVYTSGDNVYPSGSSSDFANCYNPTWGRHKSRTRPTPGIHDYNTSGASAYFAYFGSAAGTAGKGYYSYDLGAWHVVALNSQIDISATSAQLAWLKSDLAAASGRCIVAYFYLPRFSSGTTHGGTTAVQAAWQVLYDAHAELVLNGHEHNYERFAPQTPTGAADPQFGIREFVVGTGGSESGYSFGTPVANSEVRNSTTFGVLQLTLDSASYSWKFVPVAGKTFTDAGTAPCHAGHGAPAPPPANQAPTARPGGPYAGAAGDTIHFNGSASSDPDGNTPLTYAWTFGDGASGSGATPTHVYAATGSFTVTLVVTDSRGAASQPATTTATIGTTPNQPPVARPGGPYAGVAGSAVQFDGSASSDPDGNTPLTYAWTFGDGASGTGATPAHSYAAAGTYSVSLVVTDSRGASSAPGTTSATIAAAPPPPPGDSTVTLIVAGNIASCGSTRDELTAQILDTTPGTVLTLGDAVMPDASAYTTCYDPSWGRHKARTYNTLGNHDYYNGHVSGVWDYWGDRAGPRNLGYYSFDVGAWHIIVLNSNGSFVPDGAGSAQDVWLQNDLAANTKKCTLATFHQPRFFSSDTPGWTSDDGVKNFWTRLYAAGVDLVLNGQQHQYERLKPMTPDGVVDNVQGIRSIDVGTGGESTAMPVAMHPNSEVVSDAFGVLKVTLFADHYTWQFVPMQGQSFSDQGSGTCH
jgi:PKD repeat protein